MFKSSKYLDGGRPPTELEVSLKKAELFAQIVLTYVLKIERVLDMIPKEAPNYKEKCEEVIRKKWEFNLKEEFSHALFNYMTTVSTYAEHFPENFPSENPNR